MGEVLPTQARDTAAGSIDSDAPIPTEPVPGWKGGFYESEAAFALPDSDLSSLPMLDNMDNIDLLQRQQNVKWPEFSWLTRLGDENARCFQMFAPYISRLGYTDEGRVYSIICPQQGAASPNFGSMNVEVTVTGQRGWVDEPNKQLAADMSVTGKVWFSPAGCKKEFVKLIWDFFKSSGRPFPFSKAHAICVETHKAGDPSEPLFRLSKGQSKLFTAPEFAQHNDEAWSVGNLGVQIGAFKKTGDEVVDDFNTLLMVCLV